MPCLFALLAVLAPRLAYVLLWLFTPVVNIAFSSWITPHWLWPLLGVIFLPFTTLMYTLLAAALGDMNIWTWLVVALGFLLDLGAFGQSYMRRLRGAAAQ